MIITKVQIDTKQLKEVNKFIEGFNEEMQKMPYQFTKIIAKHLRRQVLLQQKKAPRGHLAANIRASRRSQNTSVVKMPMKLAYLDSMKPHYVSLKRGRQITRWARKYYDGSYATQRRSNVRRGPRGGISGYLYVTPDPFVDTAMMKATRRIVEHIDKTLDKLGG